jgi:membrane protease subunit HflK
LTIAHDNADQADTGPNGPVAQSIGIAFRVLYAAIALLAVAWAASNWRQVPADSQAVVTRFGAVVGQRPAGLAGSWPRPVGEVVLVPGPDRLLTVHTLTTAQRGGLEDIFTTANDAGIPEGAGSYLTGDGGVVLLSAAITYQVSDGPAYMLARTHVEPALRRIFAAAAVRVAAGRTLDDVLVARPDAAAGDPGRTAALEARRQAMRGDLLAGMNRRLAELAAAGAPLGVAATRIDLDAALPPAAKIAFDGVLVAVQLSGQGVAGARTDAARMTQAADRERDRLLSAAHAAAAERVGEAQARTAPILALQAGMTPASRPAALDQVYRDGIGALLRRAGRVTAVDAAGGARIILPASPPAPGP